MVRPTAASPLLQVVLVAALTAGAAAQATLHVPAQHATVQAAIDAAPPGATVLLAAGTYSVTNLDPGGREITIRGELGAAQTVLDGNLQGRIIDVHNDEGPGLVFEGLTFRHGVAPLNGRGGAMRVTGLASPRVIDCVFEQNEGALSGAALLVEQWAGVQLTGCSFGDNVSGAFWSETTGDVRISQCTFAQNSDGTTLFADGLGSGTIEVADCTFHDNNPSIDLLRLDDLNGSLLRCAIHDNSVPRRCVRYNARESFQTIEVVGCNLNANVVERSLCEVLGAGIASIYAPPVCFSDCTFTDNVLTTGNARSCLQVLGNNVEFTNCTFARNTSSTAFAIARIEGLITTSGSNFCTMSRCRIVDNTTAATGMVLLSASASSIDNCLFADNEANSGTSVLFVTGGTPATVAHCTFANNAALTGTSGGAVHDVPSLTSSILYGNVPMQIDGTATNASYCDVEGGFAGTGNFDADPLFAASGAHPFRLGLGSPCVDTGEPGVANTGLDLDGQPRVLGLRTDVGCDESTAQPLPGTDGDLFLTTTLDGQGDPLAAQKQAQVGQLLELQVQSLTGQGVGAWTLVLGELRTTGAPQPGSVLLPGMHLDVFSTGFFVILDSLSVLSPLGSAGLPGQGLTMSLQVPAGLAGSSVHLQSLGIDLPNGFYAASNCHEVVLP